MTTHIKLIFLGILSFAVLLGVPSAYAGQPYTVITLFNHTSDPIIRSLDMRQYNFDRFPTIKYQFVDLRGTAAQQQVQIENAISKYPNAIHDIVFGGHGVTRGDGTDGGVTRQAYTRFAHDALLKVGAQGSVTCDDCGSGRLPGQFPGGQQGGPLNSVGGSSDPNRIGLAPDHGSRIQSNVLNGFRGDADGDGIITNQEFADAMDYDTRRGEIKVINPDAPKYFRDKEAFEKWQASQVKVECVFLQPGLVDKEYDPPEKTGINIINRAFGYGPLGPPEGEEGVTDSPINAELRKAALAKGDKKIAKIDVYFEEISTRLQETIKNPDNKGKLAYIRMPNGAEAMEYATTGQGKTYTVGGIPITAGQPYFSGTTNTDGLTVDKSCNPKKQTDPDSSRGGNQPGNQEWDNEDGSNLGNGGGSQQASDNSILSALMQALLGNKGQQANQQQGQNQYGAGAPLPCKDQKQSAVCGANGITYNNPCYLLESDTVQVSTGVCAGSNSIMSGNSNIFTQLSQSGAPLSLLDSLKNSVASIFSNIISGKPVSETVIR